jgi:hypothetical protein
MADTSPGVLSVGLNGGLSYRAGEYNPGDLKKLDREIRHLRPVVQRCHQVAEEILRQVGPHFEIVVSDKASDQRPRVYVCPRDSEGVRLELSKAVLLLAALSQVGH